MATCPNKSSEDWKLLVASRGENMAYFLWDKYNGEVPEAESGSEIVKSGLKAISLLQSDNGKKIFEKGKKVGWDLNKILTELQIPKEQKQLILNKNITDREEIITSLLAENSFVVEVNTIKENASQYAGENNFYISEGELYGDYTVVQDLFSENIEDYRKNGDSVSKEEYLKAQKYSKSLTLTNTNYYSNLTVPGGANYTENEIATPSITPSIKGHAQFATDNGIGWFRSDEKDTLKRQPAKTRRILEVQSDLFQKGRDKKDLTNNKPDVVLPIGTSGSGKSTFIKSLPQENLVIIEPDAMRVEFTGDMNDKSKDKEIYEEAANRAIQAIKQGKQVVFDTTNLTKDKRLPFIEAIKKEIPTANIQYKLMELNPELAKQRIKADIAAGKNRANVPDTTIDRHAESYKQMLEDIKNEPITNYENNQNQFLQLLNKNNNWVTFFIKSIIQDSQKKGYEKVLFPSGNTASKVEGHTTLEEFKKDKQARIKELENQLGFYEGKDEKGNIIGTAKTKEEAEQKFSSFELVEFDDTEKNKNEINQLKQEIERVEKEGFGTLKPIFNFYENTVTNILNKIYGKENVNQITDEYGNTWNEINLEEEKDINEILLQKDGPASVATKETLKRVEAVAKAMSVNVVTLENYAKANPSIDVTNMNGVADLTLKVIGVAVGKEDVALTEEVVHMATAILEQTNTKLVTELISKIDRFDIYKKVFEDYKNIKAYQLSNGKPDIRKIKKEAVDKLIAEVIINDSQNTEQFPELRAEETISMIKRWWKAILDSIRGIYRDTNIDAFKEAAEIILEGDFGSVDDIVSQGVFAQAVSNPVVTNLFNDIINVHSRLKLNTIEEGYEKRHYSYTNELGEVKEINETVTEKIDKGDTSEKRTGLDLIQDESKRMWGNEGHEFIMNYINENLIDPITGLTKTPTDERVETQLNPEIVIPLKEFARTLIAKYPVGTRFIIEKKVVNKSKTLASTVDFMALEPVINKEGNEDVKIDILDWKFSSINKSITDDIPWFKQSKWKKQMGEYTRMMNDYGVKPVQFRKTRMVPFIMNYTNMTYMKPKDGLYASSIEIGDLDNLTETETYLLPVPIRTESTGNETIDKLVSSLYAHYDKLMTRAAVSVTEKHVKNERLNLLSVAIRRLQLNMEFAPLVSVGATFVKSAKATLNSFKDIDYSTLSKEEINTKLGNLLSIRNSAVKFMDIDSDFLSTKEKGLTEDDRKILESLGDISQAVKLMDVSIKKYLSEYAVQLGIKNGFYTEANGEILLAPEKAEGWFFKNLLETSKLSLKVTKLATNIILKAKSLVDVKFVNEMKTFKNVLIPLELEAKSMGVNAFDLIGKMTDSTLELIKKVDSTFMQSINDARVTKSDVSKEYIKDNIDLDAFNKEVAEILRKQEEYLRETIWDPNDAKNNDRIASLKIVNAKNRLDINRKLFNGWTDTNFINLVNKHLKIEDHLSEEYKNMAKIPTALAMWVHLTKLNERAMDLGYLNNKGASFFPLIEATTMQKFSATEDVGREFMDFFRDLKTTKIEEKKAYSRIDPETHKIKKEVPTYYTKTDKEVYQLSKDLGRVGSLWTMALLEYESSINIENSMLALLEVEKGKGMLITDEHGMLQATGNDFDVADINDNAPILGKVIDDSIYGITEDEEGADISQDIRKGIESANVLIRSQAVGLKYMLSIANWFGFNMQSFIMAGGVYRYREFLRNNSKVTFGQMSEDERALLDMMVPLTDDIVKEQQRIFTKEYNYKNYINTWTFSDVMQVSNSFPDKLLQMANAMSFNENTMVIDGALVNIREYVRQQDRKNRDTMTASERQALKATQQSRIDELKATKSLTHLVKVTDTGASIPGVSDEEIAKYRVKIQDYTRSLNGQMDPNNKAAYKRNIIARSFMMFRTWAPKLISVRALDIQYNTEQENWEYGRGRLWIETILKIGYTGLWKMHHLINGSEEGIKIMDEMLEEKRESHYQKTGQVLTISREEYFDLVQEELSRQVKELRLLVGIVTTVVGVKTKEPPEDSTTLEKNRYKSLLRVLSKVEDELSFYYDPRTFTDISKGSVLPALSLVASVLKVFGHIERQSYGYVIEDEKLMDKARPLKYTLNLIPVAGQIQNDVIPLFDSQLAKDMGIIVSKEARRN